MSSAFWQRRYGALELALVAVIVATLVVMALRHMSRAATQAEWARHVGNVHDIRSALMLHAMLSVVRGERAALAALPDANPAELPLRTSIGYGGELDSERDESPDGGRWYFDTVRRTLVYVPMWPAPGTRLEAPVHYRVRLLFEDGDGDGRFEASSDRFHGVTLERHPL